MIEGDWGMGSCFPSLWFVLMPEVGYLPICDKNHPSRACLRVPVDGTPFDSCGRLFNGAMLPL